MSSLDEAAPGSQATPIEDGERHPLFSAFPETEKLSREDLQELLSNEHYFKAFLGSTAHSQALETAKLEALQCNEDVTSTNLNLQARLQQLRETAATAFHQASDLKSQWADLSIVQDHSYKRFSSEKQLARLRAAVADAEHASDHLSTLFQRGELESDEFSRQLTELRREYHRRALQLDKWNHGQVRW